MCNARGHEVDGLSLRDGVEQCITLLGNGFLSHPANEELRRRVSAACTGNERINADSFYRQLLRLVYRFLFLLVSEDRGLLSSLAIYRQHYSITRLRRLVDQRAAYTDHDDLWQSLRVLWLLLIKDLPLPHFADQPMAAALGLPVLNGDLFAPQDLDAATLANCDLLQAFWQLAWYQETRTSPPRRVNYAALDVEELGSVYESLLEFHPAIDADAAGRPVFQLLPGSERKTTGSYYTPPELVAELVKSALDPVLQERLTAANLPSPLRGEGLGVRGDAAANLPSPPLGGEGSGVRGDAAEKAILSLRVCDPACGSGHFLLAAARRLGKELARVRTGEDEPAPERIREAIRDVISHCIYGVDKNLLAVDLCRVALWLESYTADKPLTFLDHRIRCGDSLVGVFHLRALNQGIPDKAFESLEGDDRETARALARQNRDERAAPHTLYDWGPEGALGDFTRHSRELDEIADDSPVAVRRKRQLFEESHREQAWLRQKQACDLWTAAFFQPLQPGAPVITSAALAEHLASRQIHPQTLALSDELSWRQRFFHWPLEFPEVFAGGGFDVILSNPPWERVKLQEQEFFAARDARIATAPNKAARTRLIKELPESDPALHREFIDSLRAASAASAFMRHAGRYPLAGRGDINTYSVFAELATSAIVSNGRAGVILPKGIATDDTTKHFFNCIVENGRLIQLIGFENEEFIFPAVDHRVTFCTLTVGGGANPVSQSRIRFYIRRFSQLAEESRFFHLAKNDFWLLNPNTGNCPIFRTQADAELTKAIYRRVPVLWREARDGQPAVNPWRLSFKTLFHMANDSHYFRTAAELQAEGYRLEGNIFVGPDDRYLPLYEAKMLHQFDHRFSTYEGATERQLNVGILPQPTAEQKRDPRFVVQPRYWVQEKIVESAIPKYPEPLALAVQAGHQPSIRHVLCVWAAGHYLNHDNPEAAEKLLLDAGRFEVGRAVIRALGHGLAEEQASRLDTDFPLKDSDVHAIVTRSTDLDNLAADLIARFSPKWFLRWRDITNAGNERTIIASVTPRAPVGHTFPLSFLAGVRPNEARVLLASLNSFVADYVARQKVGGTHITYNLFKQFPILSLENLMRVECRDAANGLKSMFPHVLELVYTAHDLAPLAKDCGFDGPPFRWDDDRRFEIRCELDAAFFHLYLPCEAGGDWRPAEGETPEQLAALKKHFLTPRHAVSFVLDQFPIVRQKDEDKHGRYRTKERILEIYDAMLAAQGSGNPYRTALNPPPGQGSDIGEG